MSFGKFRAFVVPLWWFWLLKRLTEETILSGDYFTCLHAWNSSEDTIDNVLEWLEGTLCTFQSNKAYFSRSGKLNGDQFSVLCDYG